jgi:hypothetical protein
MSNNNPKSGLLAHWYFTNEEWREFLYYEKLEYESRNFIDLRAVLIGAIVILSIIALFGAAKGGPAVFIFVMLAGGLFIGICYLIHRLIRKSNERKLQTQTGEVQITKSWVGVNGVYFDWGKGWSRPQIHKDYIYLGKEKMMLLNFTSTGYVSVKGGREQIEKKCLVPVPPGKESEADVVISEINNPFNF